MVTEDLQIVAIRCSLRSRTDTDELEVIDRWMRHFDKHLNNVENCNSLAQELRDLGILRVVLIGWLELSHLHSDLSAILKQKTGHGIHKQNTNTK